MALRYAGSDHHSPVARPIVLDWGTADMNNVPDDERHRINRAITDLTGQLGRSPNASELAARLGVDREEVIESLTWRRAFSERCAEASDSTANAGASAEDLDVLEAQLAARVKVKGLPLLFGVLTDQERRVVLLRLAKSLPQSQIAARLGVTPVTVSRILTRTLEVLRSATE